MSVYTVVCMLIALPFTQTLGGGDVKAYFIIVEPNLAYNIGLLDVLVFTILPGYVPTPEDLRLREVYWDWIHGNPGTHLDSSVTDNSAWQAWWRDLAVISSRRYDVPSGKVGRWFIGMLGAEIQGMW